MTTSTKIAGRGYNSAFQLLGYTNKTIEQVVWISLLDQFKVQEIGSGESYSIALLTNGQVFGWNSQEAGKFKEIETPEREPVQSFVCGNNMFLTISQSGKLFLYTNLFQQVKLLMKPEGATFTQVACPDYDFYALPAATAAAGDSDNNNLLYYIDTAESNGIVSKLRIEGIQQPDRITRIYSKNQVSAIFVRTAGNRVFAKTRTGNAGRAMMHASVNPGGRAVTGFAEIPFFKTNSLHELYVGGTFCVASLVDGRWLIFGNHSNSKYKQQDVHEFFTLPFPAAELDQVSCNWYSAMFLTKSNKLYGVGSNTFYELGPSSLTMTETKVVDVSNHSIPELQRHGQILQVIGAGGQFFFFVGHKSNWSNKMWKTASFKDLEIQTQSQQ